MQSLICIGACVAYEDDLGQTLRSERKVLGKAKVADTMQTGNVNQKLRVKLLSVLVLVSLWSFSRFRRRRRRVLFQLASLILSRRVPGALLNVIAFHVIAFAAC